MVALPKAKEILLGSAQPSIHQGSLDPDWPLYQLGMTLARGTGHGVVVRFTRSPVLTFANLAPQTTVGVIVADLSNYDDDDAGGGNAWPCFVDEFVEWVQAGAGAQ
mmetsp:Transcript_24280/g.66929  ORF Transcript_24280/g.66929 Transcript_24280/m.66929 type:complete len:106 (-) Transcript_24280:424-741(-)